MRQSLNTTHFRAHRGCLAGGHEHTLESYAAAMAGGATSIEIDVQKTSDGVAVCIHDTTWDRTTDGTGSVSSTTFAASRAYDAGNGQQVPSLVEALALMRDFPGFVFIEPKVSAMPEIAKAVEEARFPVDKLAIITGLGSDTPTTVHALMPSVGVWGISGGTPTSEQAYLTGWRNTTGYDGILFWPITITSGDVALMRAADLGLGLIGVNPNDAWTWTQLGLNQLTLDDCGTAMSVYTTALWTQWTTANSIPGASQTADSNSDGFTNLEEMVFGMSPGSALPADPAYGIRKSTYGVGANRIVEFMVRIPPPKVPCFWWEAQYSDNGSSWTTVPANLVFESNFNFPRDNTKKIVVAIGRMNATNRLVRLRPKFLPRT